MRLFSIIVQYCTVLYSTYNIQKYCSIRLIIINYNIARFLVSIVQYFGRYCTAGSMNICRHMFTTAATWHALWPVSSSSTPTFAYNIVSKQGRYILNITNATEIFIRDDKTGSLSVHLQVAGCPHICPNLPYSEIYISVPVEHGKEPAILRFEAGSKGDLWIRKYDPNAP